MAQCLIPGCSNPAPYYLGVRLRRPAGGRRLSSGTAIWAPNCDAHLCAVHASQGYDIEIKLKPLATRQISTSTSAGGLVKTKTTQIKHLP